MANSTADVLGHHLSCFERGDLDGIVEDYSHDAVLFTPDGVLNGPAAIRGLFVKMFAEFAKPGASFEMVRQDTAGEAAYIIWRAETADNVYELGTDTFVIRDGQIVLQSFAGKITPKTTSL